MYIPAHFSADDDAVRDLLINHGAADLITSTAKGLLATMLPFIYEEPGSTPDAGEHGRLLGHVARNNDHWRVPADGEALVIVRGPDAYISPAWYEAKREHGRVVPTWNYVTAHVYGRLVIHDDPGWVEALVRRLTTRHEGARPRPWTVDDAPPPYIEGQLRAIVGLELVISRIEAKFKLSQNRSDADVAGVIKGLTAAGRSDIADAMRDAPRPRKHSPSN
jgi:transcriptional regulator